jgi:predicted permease
VSVIRGLVHRFRVLVDPDGYAREVEREIRFHLDREAMHKRDLGLEADEASAAARRQFGNVTYVREEVRRMTTMGWFDRLRQDLGYAIRGLRRSPGFTAAVALTLGLGLGVNAAMFSFLDRVFMKSPAGVSAPGAVRRVYAGLYRKDEPNSRWFVPYLWYPQIRDISRAVDSSIMLGLFDHVNDSVSVSVGDATMWMQRGIANGDFFRVVGVRPQLGRLFDPSEDEAANPASVAVISHAMWQRVFNGDPNVVGSTFRIKYRPITVIGVAAKGFSGIDLGRTDFWLPVGNLSAGSLAGVPWYETFRGQFSVVTRFANPAAEQRFVQVASLAAAGARVRMFGDSTAEVRTGPIKESGGPGKAVKEESIAIRLGGVALIVLLITLANVSNLLVVRATRREREIAIRRALGVSRGRLFGQLLTESVVLALIGGAVAMLLAFWVGAALRGLLLPDVKWATAVLDLRVVGVAAFASLVIGVLVGLAPALHAWRPELLGTLRAGGKIDGYRRSHLRNGLLVAQAALSVVLLVGSGLFVRSLRNVRAVDVGFDLYRTHILRVAADTGSITRDLTAAMPDLMERVATIPGVERVAASSAWPMLGESFAPLILPGHDSLPMLFGRRTAAFKSVTPGYFSTVGQRILAGRAFVDADGPSIIVSEPMAKAYWPGESPLGKCLIMGKPTDPCRPVIGVVPLTHRFQVIDDDFMAQYYTNVRTASTLILRMSPERGRQTEVLVTAEVKRLLPRASSVRVTSMADVIINQLRPWELGSTLFTAMGILALVVAAIGVYSVLAYATSQRTNEMGIRIALGASLGDVARLVVGEGLLTIAIGIVVGVGLAFAAGKLVASMLYGISPRDPVTMMLAAVILGLVGIAACAIPAWRAARVDPVTALRVD